MSKVVVAAYDRVEDAQAAIDELIRHGFDRANIGLAVHHPHAEPVTEDVSGEEGAGFGAVVGGLTGLVAGLVAITIPGIGPIVAAGPLAAVLGGATGAAIGAAAGAVTGGITASLIDLGVPEDEVDYYTEAVRRGGALVTVTTSEFRTTDALMIMRRHRPIDVEERAAQWREEGWEGYRPEADALSAEEIAEERRRY